MKTILSICLLLLPATAARAQTDAPEDPVVSSLRGLHDITANYVLQAAEMLDDDMYAFRATDDVDRKSTRLNSSHVAISYAVFCLKKKKTSAKRRRHNKEQSKSIEA